jgi:hypothetical protein
LGGPLESSEAGEPKNIWETLARTGFARIIQVSLGGIIIKKKSNTLLTIVSPEEKKLVDQYIILGMRKRHKNIKKSHLINRG